MLKKIKRYAEIVIGTLLVILGVILIFTPGQGTLVIIAGVMLVSPYHGRRLVWWIKQLWKRTKGWWYSWRFKRVIKSKIIKRARKLKKKLERIK